MPRPYVYLSFQHTQEVLGQARRDEAAQEAVRRRLRAAGELWRCAFMVELYCQRALRALAQVNPLEPAGSGLREMIDHISFFPKGTRP